MVKNDRKTGEKTYEELDLQVKKQEYALLEIANLIGDEEVLDKLERGKLRGDEVLDLFDRVADFLQLGLSQPVKMVGED